MSTPTALQPALDLHDEFIQCEAEMLEQIAGRRRFTKAIDSEHRVFQADVLAPEIGDSRLDRDTSYALWRNAFPIGGVLAVEHAGRRHRDHGHRDSLFGHHSTCAGHEGWLVRQSDAENPAVHNLSDLQLPDASIMSVYPSTPEAQSVQA